MRVTPDRLDVAPTPDLDPEEVRRALGEYFSGKQYSEFAVDKIVAAAREWLRLREQPAPDVRPKWCNVHQHHKWCEHNGGVMGPTGYAAPDVQAQMIASLSEQVHDMRKGHQAQIDAAVAREREECAETCLRIWREATNERTDSIFTSFTQNKISHGCIASAAAIRARSAKGV